MRTEDYDRIATMLQDTSLSYREIGRQTGVSDWTIRKIARELDGDPHPMRSPHSERRSQGGDEASDMTGWIVLTVVVGCFAMMIWAGVRWTPPPET
ncbi:MAG: hypothetical protein WAK16_02935 [Candidatus Cybelea sp.]